MKTRVCYRLTFINEIFCHLHVSYFYWSACLRIRVVMLVCVHCYRSIANGWGHRTDAICERRAARWIPFSPIRILIYSWQGKSGKPLFLVFTKLDLLKKFPVAQLGDALVKVLAVSILKMINLSSKVVSGAVGSWTSNARFLDRFYYQQVNY